MGRKNTRTQKKVLSKLLEAGGSALIIGAALLALPPFLPQPVLRDAFLNGTRVAGLLALGIGALFIALHFFLRRGARGEAPAKKEPEWTSWSPPELLRREQSGFLMTETPPITRTMPHAQPRRAAQGGRETAWSAKVFDDIEWRRFEAVCESLFAQGGFETKSQSHGPDGGVDIWLHSKNAGGPAAIVQCKHWTKPVGVKELREFFGVMASHKLKRGTFATTSTFTPDAMRFAKANGINTMGRERLLALIARRTPEQQAQLLQVAYEGEYWKPTCASCGVKMVERKSSRGTSAFWGCVHFPQCRSMLPMRAAPGR